MQDFWKTLVATLLSAAAVSGAVIWLLQKSAEKYIGFITDKQLESFKHGLEEELETYKGAVSTDESANQLRFDRNLSFRAEQLSEFYWPIYIRLQIDNAVWERALGAQTPNRLPADIGRPMEVFLLENHREILKVIESKFYLAELSPNLEKDLLDYVRHAAVYLAMRTTRHYDDKVPVDLNEPWPSDLFPRFKARLDTFQSEYNAMLIQQRSLKSGGAQPKAN